MRRSAWTSTSTREDLLKKSLLALPQAPAEEKPTGRSQAIVVSSLTIGLASGMNLTVFVDGVPYAVTLKWKINSLVSGDRNDTASRGV